MCASSLFNDDLRHAEHRKYLPEQFVAQPPVEALEVAHGLPRSM